MQTEKNVLKIPQQNPELFRIGSGQVVYTRTTSDTKDLDKPQNEDQDNREIEITD